MRNFPFKTLTGGALSALAIAFVLLLILVHVISPATGGPLGILVVFVLLYVISTSSLLVITGLLSLLRSKLFDQSAMQVQKRYYISSVVGFLPVLYLTLLSMGGASIWGIALIFLFVGLALFYVLKRSA